MGEGAIDIDRVTDFVGWFLDGFCSFSSRRNLERLCVVLCLLF